MRVALILSTGVLSLMEMSTVAAAGEEDRASLDHLADIVVSPPVSWWPVAPAWYAVMGAVSLCLISAMVTIWQRRRRNAYRAAALAELERVGTGAEAVTQIAHILKRTALAIAPRREVAALNGEHWLCWLDQFGNGVAFSEKSKQILTEHLYGAEHVDDADVDALTRSARVWILKHRACSTPPTALPSDRNR